MILTALTSHFTNVSGEKYSMSLNTDSDDDNRPLNHHSARFRLKKETLLTMNSGLKISTWFIFPRLKKRTDMSTM